jgi:DNA repair photolyase
VFVRWEQQSVATAEQTRLPGYRESVVRTFDAPEALDVRFHEVYAKSALNRVPGGARVPFNWTVNPYRGCLHACTYCFARPTHEYLNLDAGRDFEREVIVKVNVPEVLRRELARPSWKGEHVALGTNTDPYQWVEKKYGLMRGIWEALRDARNPCSILTKSPLVLRDADLLQEIAQVTTVSACLSIAMLDEKVWRSSEPHTPHPRARLEAVKRLNELGIPTGILIAPLMPGLNDSPEQVEKLLDAAYEAGAVSVGGQALFLRGSTRDVFMDWLKTVRPDLVDHYEELYARGAYLRGKVKDDIEAPLREGRRRREQERARTHPRFRHRPAPGGGREAPEGAEDLRWATRKPGEAEDHAPADVEEVVKVAVCGGAVTGARADDASIGARADDASIGAGVGDASIGSAMLTAAAAREPTAAEVATGLREGAPDLLEGLQRSGHGIGRPMASYTPAMRAAGAEKAREQAERARAAIEEAAAAQAQGSLF